MFVEMDSSDPGLCPIKGHLSVPCRQAKAQNQFSSLSLSATSTTPPCQMLVIHPALNLIIDILTVGHQGRLRSWLLVNRIAPCDLGDFISPLPGMCRDPIHPHSVPGSYIIQCILALLYQWRLCFGSLKCFHSSLAIRANTNLFLCPTLSFNLKNTG